MTLYIPVTGCSYGCSKYNDIANWKWTSLLNSFGDLDGKRSRSYTVKTTHELSVLLEDEDFKKADKIQLVEVVMDKRDAPRALKETGKLMGKASS